VASKDPIRDVEFGSYLRWLSERCDEIIVVDGSPAPVFAEHHRRWASICEHRPPARRTVMGKVGGVLTGIRTATHDRIVVADDDVRYGDELTRLVERLDEAEVVRPQNYFDPLPWHAIWDSGRCLLNRMTGGDWPGTLAVRRTPALVDSGYPGDVMFENFELCKTVEALGGRHLLADDIFVRRLPPTTRHFFDQRVRQAYDELARPLRFLCFLGIVPAVALLVATGRRRLAGHMTLGGMIATLTLAELGRQRAGARNSFPLRCSLAAPVWVVERSLCTWSAAAARVRGGVRYRERRLRRAARTSAERQHDVDALRLASNDWLTGR
jgi:hypothetical protein